MSKVIVITGASSGIGAALAQRLAGDVRMDLRATHPDAQTPEEVAECIAGLIAYPVPEIYTNPAHPELARAYYQDVAAFEAKAASGAAAHRG
jgi:NAD(P)-dependent dehydrogenase (short-subunit alcohol dehydrogenase family)